MPTFQRFEDIQVWQKSRYATKRIYEMTMSNKFSRDFGLSNQIRRASVSVMSNIAEGNGRKTNKDFANFLIMSHGSAAEVQSHLYIAFDLGYINESEFLETYKLFDEISRMTMSLCKHLQKS